MASSAVVVVTIQLLMVAAEEDVVEVVVGGRHRRRGGQQGRGRDGQRFQGQEDGLKGFIYDLQTHKSPDQYIRTTQEVANYVGHTHKKHMAVFIQSVEGLELDMPTEPADPPSRDVIAPECWKVQFK